MEKAGIPFAELFAGGGSVHIAMSRAGFTTAYANDFCRHKAKSYRANFPEVRFDPRPIEQVRGHELPHVELITASSPCQDHSVQGERRGFGDGERGVVAFHVLRLVDELRALGRAPKVLAFENVPGLLSVDDGRDFAALCTSLVSHGYVVGALLMNARQFLPQNRLRLFLVAVRRDVAVPRSLARSSPVARWHTAPLKKAHAALPIAVRAAWRWWTLPAPPSHPPTLTDLIEDAPADPRWLAPVRLEEVKTRMQPQDHAAIEAARQAGVRFGVTMQKRRSDASGARMLRQQVAFDGVARCLLASEGHEAQQLVVVDDEGFSVRPFTSRERARLTGLPDTYVLPANIRTRELTGDAVVVPVYEHLAQHLLAPLARAAVSASVQSRRGPVQRARKDTRGGSTANRPMKRRTTRLEVGLVPAAHQRISALAADANVGMAEFLLAAVDRDLSSRGLPPLPRYVPEPRRGIRSGGRRAAPSPRGAGARGRIGVASTPVRCPGGKAKVASRLVSLLGATTCLVEPFAGSAAVSVRALLTGATDRIVLAERDHGLRCLWQVVSAGTSLEFRALLSRLEEAKPSRAWWADFIARTDGDKAPDVVAARRLLASRFHWGGIVQGGLARDEELQRHWRVGTMVERLHAIRRQRSRISLRGDAMQTIHEFRDDGRVSFFVDPPYSFAGGPGARLYEHHDLDHAAMLSSLARVRGRVLVTYDDRPQVRALAANHGFSMLLLGIRDAHHRGRTELLLSKGTGPPLTPSG